MFIYYLLGLVFSIGIKQAIRQLLESKLNLKAAKVLKKYSNIEGKEDKDIAVLHFKESKETVDENDDPFETAIKTRYFIRLEERKAREAKTKSETEIVVKRQIVPKLQVLEEKTNNYYRSYILGVSARKKSISVGNDPGINCRLLKLLTESYNIKEV